MRESGSLVYDLTDRLRAIQVGHDDVHQDDVGLRRTRQRHGLYAVLSLGQHCEAADPFAEIA